MSKSIGNVVEPNELIDAFGIDTVRLYFLSQGPLSKDIDFRPDDIKELHNQFFIDQYMNLLFRVCAKKILKSLKNEIKRPQSFSEEERELHSKIN